MKQFITFLVFTLPLSAFSQHLEWVSRLEVDTVDFPGNRHIFIQHCTTSVDSLVANGSTTFSNAYLNHVGPCVYKLTFSDTVLVETRITVKGRKAGRELMDYCELLSGNDPHQDRGGFEFIPVRAIEHKGMPLVMKLKRKRIQRKTILVLTSEVAFMKCEG